MADKEYNITDFARVVISGAFDGEINQSASYHVAVSRNMLKHLGSRVRIGGLASGGTFSPDGECEHGGSFQRKAKTGGLMPSEGVSLLIRQGILLFQQAFQYLGSAICLGFEDVDVAGYIEREVTKES